MTLPRRVGLFLVSLLSAATVLMAGLANAWRSGGQADPWTWALPAVLLLALMGQWLAKRPWPLQIWPLLIWPLLIWVAVGTSGTALVFCAIAAARPPDPVAAIGLVLATLLAGVGSLYLRNRGKRLVGCALLILAGLLLWRGPAPPITTQPDRPTLAVLTALPLFWQEAGQGLVAPVDAPIVTALRTRFTVQPIDDPAALAASRARVLLLAQPRAISSQGMGALDQWVRAGDRALILADPLLHWPSTLPIGDRRRAPSASLLGPLLAHWGLEPDGAPVEEEMRHFMPDGRLIT
ncbi:MAG: Gldg family protein, partial [bacterium]|nr:Gldg family protein [bacterium]